jgi:hypothetical protein
LLVLLIDDTHRRWAYGTTAVAAVSLLFAYWLHRTTPDGLQGGSTVGLWFGVAGSALMVFAGLLSGLRTVPSWWWIGSRKAWLKGHIWLGLLSGVLILCHSGFKWGGWLTGALWVVLIAVLASGIFGLIAQQILPRMLTQRVPSEAPYEQIPHLCRRLRAKGDDVIGAMLSAIKVDKDPTGSTMHELGSRGKLQVVEFFEKQARPFLADGYPPTSPLFDPLRAEAAFAGLHALPEYEQVRGTVEELQKLCDERRQLAEQERLYRWLHMWLLLHIPLSAALLVLGVAHVILSLAY